MQRSAPSRAVIGKWEPGERGWRARSPVLGSCVDYSHVFTRTVRQKKPDKWLIRLRPSEMGLREIGPTLSTYCFTQLFAPDRMTAYRRVDQSTCPPYRLFNTWRFPDTYGRSRARGYGMSTICQTSPTVLTFMEARHRSQSGLSRGLGCAQQLPRMQPVSERGEPAVSHLK